MKYVKALLVCISLLSLSFTQSCAQKTPNLKSLFEQVNELEEKSPSFFQKMIKRRSSELLKSGSEASPFLFANYLSVIGEGLKKSYKVGHVNIANRKHDLMRQLFVELNLKNNDSALGDIAEADFYRWIYTNEDKYKVMSLEGFQKAEDINVDEVNKNRLEEIRYISKSVLDVNSLKKKPLTSQQLSYASKISHSAYQNIAMYEKALGIRSQLKASQEELSLLAQEGLDVYHAANKRLQPNNLDRAYIGVLMALARVLDDSHFKKFETEYNSMEIKHKILRSRTPRIHPYIKIEKFLGNGQMSLAINELDNLEKIYLKSFKNQRKLRFMIKEKLDQRCRNPPTNPIFVKLAAYDPKRYKKHTNTICLALQKAIEKEKALSSN